MGLGLIPFMPGTITSLAGGIIFYLIGKSPFFPIITILITLLSFIISYIAYSHVKDDLPSITVDELSGMLIAYTFHNPTILTIIAGFILFRLFDILKPFPVRYFDNIKGGFGIMMDDIVAGILTSLLLFIPEILWHGQPL